MTRDDNAKSESTAMNEPSAALPEEASHMMEESILEEKTDPEAENSEETDKPEQDAPPPVADV